MSLPPALPFLTCASCGVMDIPRLEDGPSPGERRKAVCTHCGHYLKWLPKSSPAHEETRLMDSVNVVVLTGVLETEPAIRWEPDNNLARCTGRLRCEEVNATGSLFRLYVPLEAWGKTAEALGELHAGALVSIQGKLCWRKYVTKRGDEKGTLAVLVGKVSVLVPAAVGVP